jgi:hypothetical protein
MDKEPSDSEESVGSERRCRGEVRRGEGEVHSLSGDDEETSSKEVIKI